MWLPLFTEQTYICDVDSLRHLCIVQRRGVLMNRSLHCTLLAGLILLYLPVRDWYGLFFSSSIQAFSKWIRRVRISDGWATMDWRQDIYGVRMNRRHFPAHWVKFQTFSYRLNISLISDVRGISSVENVCHGNQSKQQSSVSTVTMISGVLPREAVQEISACWLSLTGRNHFFHRANGKAWFENTACNQAWLEEWCKSRHCPGLDAQYTDKPTGTAVSWNMV